MSDLRVRGCVMDRGCPPERDVTEYDRCARCPRGIDAALPCIRVRSLHQIRVCDDDVPELHHTFFISHGAVIEAAAVYRVIREQGAAVIAGITNAEESAIDGRGCPCEPQGIHATERLVTIPAEARRIDSAVTASSR